MKLFLLRTTCSYRSVDKRVDHHCLPVDKSYVTVRSHITIDCHKYPMSSHHDQHPRRLVTRSGGNNINSKFPAMRSYTKGGSPDLTKSHLRPCVWCRISVRFEHKLIPDIVRQSSKFWQNDLDKFWWRLLHLIRLPSLTYRPRDEFYISDYRGFKIKAVTEGRYCKLKSTLASGQLNFNSVRASLTMDIAYDYSNVSSVV